MAELVGGLADEDLGNDPIIPPPFALKRLGQLFGGAQACGQRGPRGLFLMKLLLGHRQDHGGMHRKQVVVLGGFDLLQPINRFSAVPLIRRPGRPGYFADRKMYFWFNLIQSGSIWCGSGMNRSVVN